MITGGSRLAPYLTICAPGDALMIVDLIGEDRNSLAQYAWPDPDHRDGYIEWLIPAEFANSRAVIVNIEAREPATW